MANFPTKFTGSQGLTTDNKQLLQWVSSDSPSASELVLRTIAGESFYETDRAKNQTYSSGSFSPPTSSLDQRLLPPSIQLADLSLGGAVMLYAPSADREPPTPPSGEYVIYSDTPDDQHTVLLMHMDGENSGSAFRDVSGVGFTAKTITPTNAIISTAQKKFGTSSAYFDGTDDYLSVASSTDFNLGSSDFTIETWIFGAAAGETVVSIWETTENDRAFELAITTGNKMALYLSTDGTSTNSLSLVATTGLSATSWYHLAAVRDGNMVTLYVNGVAEASSSWAYSVHSTSQALAIGTERVLSPRNYFSGHLDELRISTVCRYSGSFATPTQPFGGGLRMKDPNGKIYVLSLSGSA